MLVKSRSLGTAAAFGVRSTRLPSKPVEKISNIVAFAADKARLLFRSFA